MNDTDSYTSFESKIWKREFDGVQHFVSVARVGLIVGSFPTTRIRVLKLQVGQKQTRGVRGLISNDSNQSTETHLDKGCGDVPIYWLISNDSNQSTETASWRDKRASSFSAHFQRLESEY